MTDPYQTNQNLVEEITALKRRIKQLERLEIVHKQTLAELELINNRLSRAEIIARVGIWEFDLESQRVFGSKGAQSIYGISSGEWTIPEVQKISLPEYRDMLDRALHNLIHENRPYDVEFKIRRLDSGQIVDIHSVAEYDKKRKVVFGVIQDITEHKNTEAALREESTRRRILFEQSPDGMLIIDSPTARFLEFNTAAHTQLEYSREEFAELSIFDLEVQETVEDTQKHIAEVIESGKADFETVQRTKNGHPRNIHVTAQIINVQGRPVYYCVWRDITERKQMEKALNESEERYRVLFVHSPYACIIIDSGVIVDCNHAAEMMLRGDRTQIIGHQPIDFSPEFQPDGRRSAEAASENIAQAMHAGEVYFEWLHHRLDGSDFWAEISLSPVKMFGRPVLFSACRDITERKRLEEELLRTNKLESLGVLAGGIAHDFNNLMSMVQGYVDLSIADLPHDHISHRWLQAAKESIKRTKDLTGRLITFSRGGEPRKRITDITDILNDVVIGTVKGTNIRVKFDIMENLWPMEIDQLQVKQCFGNLVTNALEAMPEGGNLKVKAENAWISDGDSLDLKDGPYLKITFADKGIGIPKENLLKIFDPYFSTKPLSSQKGLGLGLAVCYFVLKNHSGHITVKSYPKKGASFTLYFPARPELVAGKKIRNAGSTRKSRVLIMDDEPQIIEILKTYLERMGYEITDVPNGQEAINAYKKALDAGNPFNLVILEPMVHDGRGGRSAMERLLKIDPSIRAIIVSGCVGDPIMENFSNYGFLGALKKPFLKEELEHLVAKVVHS